MLQELLSLCILLRLGNAGILIAGQQPRRGNVASVAAAADSNDMYNDDDWEPVYRVYQGDDWDSHDDYLSQERTARHGDKDDSQFRSWKLDQWHHNKIQKVRIEIYDDGDEVVEFEFEGVMQNMTSFFNPRNLRKTTYRDLPVDGTPFYGDDFSFDGDDDARHWAVSYRHRGDCLNDEGWIQVIDKPKPGRDRCVCGYENVAKFPTIMYAKGGRKSKWSDPRSVGYADMMQISVSHVPYPVAPQPVPVQMVNQPQQQVPQFQIQRVYPFETKK